MDFERNYWLITIQQKSTTPIMNHVGGIIEMLSVEIETIAYEGNLVYFLLIERELGRKTNILWSKEITEEEYFYYHKQTDKRN